MALGFFRRHQKSVLIIMVILMVSFLVSAQGFERFFSPNPAKRAFGETKYGKLTYGDINTARASMNMLKQTELGAAELRLQARAGFMPGDIEFLSINRSKEPPATWLLLLEEAKHLGITVTNADVDQFLDQMRLTGEKYKSFTYQLRTDKLGNDKEFRQAVRDWLMIYRSCQQAVLDIPPSDAEMRLLFRNLKEEIDLRVVKIDAAEMAKKATTQPSDDQITAEFMKRASTPAGATDPNSYGFGYRLQDRADVSYLFIDREVAGRALKPTMAELQSFWAKNKNQLVRVEAPKTPASAPTTHPSTSSAPATMPASEETEPKIVMMETLLYTDPKVVEYCTAEKVDKIISTLLPQAKQMAANDSYTDIVKKFKKDSSAAMGAKITASIKAMPLKDAVELLAKQAGLAGIVYPYGQHGKFKLDPTITVSLNIPADKPMSLADALANISSQCKVAEMIGGWNFCQEFENVLFATPVADTEIGFFPLVAGATGLVDAGQMEKIDLLRSAVTGMQGQGDPLVKIVFTAEPFAGPAQQGRRLKLDEQEEMYVEGFLPGSPSGRLLFKLAAVSPARDATPRDLQEVPGLRAQVIEDIKISQAFVQAQELGKKIVKDAAAVGLETAAKNAGLTSYTTGYFTRLGDSGWNDIPLLGAPEFCREFLATQAFSLMPPGIGGPLAVDVPAMKDVVVMQRFGYKQALESEYDSAKTYLRAIVMNRQYGMTEGAWLNPDNIAKRTGFNRGGE